jgi:hypothetical protein
MILNPIVFWLIFIAGDAVLNVSINRRIKGFDFLFFAPYLGSAIYGIAFGDIFSFLHIGFILPFILVHIMLDKNFVYSFPFPLIPFLMGGLGMNLYGFFGVYLFYGVCKGGYEICGALYANRGTVADAFISVFVNAFFNMALFFFVAPFFM